MRAIARRFWLVFCMTMFMLAGLWEVSYGGRVAHIPVTAADSLLLATRTEKYGSAAVDQLVRWTERSTYIACPFYSATLNGQQLTRHLLGRQHEAAMELLGYSDNTPYELTVQVAVIEIGPKGRVYRDWWYESPVTKAEFDSLYSGWICGANSQVRILANPLPPKK